MRVLESPRLRLRPLAEADLPLTRAWRNRDDVRRWFRDAEPIGDEQHRAWWGAYRERPDDFVFVIEEKLPEGARPVGMVSLYRVDVRPREAEFGRFLIGEPEAAGRGLAAEATRLLVDWAFGELALERIVLEVRADNARALVLYRASGFVLERSAGGWLTMARARPPSE